MQLKFLCSLIVLAIAPPAGLAQTAARVNPGAAAAPSPSAPSYQSAFADYKPYKEPVVMSWREANDQVRDAGGMQGHDMANMKSQPADPHAGHNMSTMGAKPGVAVSPAAEKMDQDHAAHGAQKAQADDPHAGHDMSTMTTPKPAAAIRKPSGVTSNAKKGPPDHAAHGAKKVSANNPHAGHDMSKMNAPKPAAPARPKAAVPTAAKPANSPPGSKAMPVVDPHAGHDMPKMAAPAPKIAPTSTDNADHGTHGAPPSLPNNKKERE